MGEIECIEVECIEMEFIEIGCIESGCIEGEVDVEWFCLNFDDERIVYMKCVVVE